MARADMTDSGLIVAEPPPTGAFFGPPSCDDLILVHDDADRILATVQPEPEIGPEQSFIWCFPAVHPEARGTSVERLLLERLWQQASQRRSEIPSEQVYLHVHCGAHQGERIALYESLGLQLKCYSPHMAYYPLEDLPRPLPPPGIEFRPYSPGTDDESAVDTLNQAFADDPRYVPMSREQWLSWLNAPEWRRDLSLAAADGDQVVGLCLCLIRDDRIRWMGRRDGYVDTMCVRPSHQRRGVGAALLLTCLQALRQAGMVSATLETDEDNPTEAARFYQQVGFREIWRWAAHGAELR
jgi:ribosomal protein S18 acetylase RimI-like enzyme